MFISVMLIEYKNKILKCIIPLNIIPMYLYEGQLVVELEPGKEHILPLIALMFDK